MQPGGASGSGVFLLSHGGELGVQAAGAAGVRR
jgi:hypothetical protein